MILAGVALAIVAAACGGDSTDEADAGEAATVAPTTTAATEAVAGPAIVPGEDADVDAVVEAYVVVFDSSTTYEEKAPYLVEPEGLEETVATYASTGTSMGGVSLDPKSVTIDGDTAAVSYDFLFGGNPSYTNLTGDAVQTAAGWQITREMFCDIMRSARSSCPTE
jgi:hypothetical protein